MRPDPDPERRYPHYPAHEARIKPELSPLQHRKTPHSNHPFPSLAATSQRSLPDTASNPPFSSNTEALPTRPLGNKAEYCISAPTSFESGQTHKTHKEPTPAAEHCKRVSRRFPPSGRPADRITDGVDRYQGAF